VYFGLSAHSINNTNTPWSLPSRLPAGNSYLKLLGQEAPHPKLGICTAFSIFLFCLCTNSKFSMSRRPSVKEKDDEKKPDNKETCEKCKKVEPSHHALLCELCEKWFHIKCYECYKALKVVSGSHWFCDNCNIRVSYVIQGMIKTNEKIDHVIKKQGEYESALVKAEARHEVLEHKVSAIVLFFSRPRSEGWPHHGRTFSIYPCPLSF